MSTPVSDHILTFAALLEVWNSAVASSMSFGLTEQEATEAVGLWLDTTLTRQRSERRLASLDERATVVA